MNASATSVKRRIACLTASKEGAGKSTVALDLALAWAGMGSRGVVIVHLDTLWRDDVSARLGLHPSLTLADVIRLGELALRGGPRPVVPLSQWGVGCLPLAANADQAARVTPAAARRALDRLSRAYDLILVVDPVSSLRGVALRLATVTMEG